MGRVCVYSSDGQCPIHCPAKQCMQVGDLPTRLAWSIASLLSHRQISTGHSSDRLVGYQVYLRRIEHDVKNQEVRTKI